MSEDWHMPTNWIEQSVTANLDWPALRLGPQSQGTIWICKFVVDSKHQMSRRSGSSLQLVGYRLPELFRALLNLTKGSWSSPLLWDLRDGLCTTPPDLPIEEQGFYHEIEKNHLDHTTWDVYADWLLDQGRSPGVVLLERAFQNYTTNLTPSNPVFHRFFSSIQVDEHVALNCLRAHILGRPASVDWQEWRTVLFDDWWAAANPAIAESILNCPMQ